MTWTILADVTQDQPILASWGNSIRDNITALANGDAGAPRVQTSAYQDLSVTGDKIANETISNSKIANETISNSKIANVTINGNSKLQNGSVGLAKFEGASPGGVFGLRLRDNAGPVVNTGAYLTVTNYAPNSNTVVASCIRAGSVRVSMRGSRNTSNCFFRILVNQTQVYETEIGDTFYVTRAASIGLGIGDKLVVQWRGAAGLSGSSFNVSSIHITYSSSNALCVV